MAGSTRSRASRKRSVRLGAALAVAGVLLGAGVASAKLTLVAHRGGRYTHPENTLPNFSYGISIGIDWLETDVWITSDGVPLIHHDLDLCRTTDIENYGYDCVDPANNPLGRFPRVADFDLTFLRQLDAGSWFDPAFAGVQLPTLEEALDLVNGTNSVLFPEIKPGVSAQDIAPVVNASGVSADNLIFWLRQGGVTGGSGAQEFRSLLPNFRRVIGQVDSRDVTEADLQFLVDNGDYGLAVFDRWLTEEFIDLVHSYGLALYTLPAPGPGGGPSQLELIDMGITELNIFDTDAWVALRPTLVCIDDLDNDGDGYVDYGDDLGCEQRTAPSEIAQCIDGFDNDGDGATDYPADASCTWQHDAWEVKQCSNGIDDDGDGDVDLDDAHCSSPADDREKAPRCGLLGIEPLAVLVLLRRRRRGSRSTRR